MRFGQKYEMMDRGLLPIKRYLGTSPYICSRHHQCTDYICYGKRIRYIHIKVPIRGHSDTLSL